MLPPTCFFGSPDTGGSAGRGGLIFLVVDDGDARGSPKAQMDGK